MSTHHRAGAVRHLRKLVGGAACAALFAFPALTSGFSSEDPLKQPADDESQQAVDNFHHQKLTHDAAISPFVGFARPAARRLAWHADYIDSYLYSPLWWAKDAAADKGGLAKRFRRSLAIAPELEKLHFDDLSNPEQVRAAWDRYTSGAIAGLIWASEANGGAGDVEAARNIVALASHAIEDFYSHSSWINTVRDRTWQQLTPQERSAVKLFTGKYESSEPSPAEHGKINLACVVMCQKPVRKVMELVCGAGLIPLGDKKLCQLHRECKKAQVVPTGLKVKGVTVPKGLVYFAPAGIAVDAQWMSPIGEKLRRAAPFNLKKADGQRKTAFDTAYELALASTTQWLERVQVAMRREGKSDFWERVKTEAPGTFAKRHAQFENFGQSPYQFMTAGPYPPSKNSTPAEEYFLRLKIATSSKSGSGTDADIFANVDGKKFLLDYKGKLRKQKSNGDLVSAPTTDLAKNPLLEYNDFEAGDNDVYTIGPLKGPPTSLTLENRAGNAGNVLDGIANDIEESVKFVGKTIKNFFEDLIGGKADFVAENKVVFEYLKDGSQLDLAKAAANPGGMAFKVRLNGKGEGDYRLNGTVKKLGEGSTGQLGVYDEFEFWIRSADVLRESKNDQTSGSDEPFFAMVYTPIAPGQEQRIGPVGRFTDVDKGESLGFYKKATTDLNVLLSPANASQRVVVKIPRNTGLFIFSVTAFESDFESKKTRQGLAKDYAGKYRNAVKDEKAGFISALGKVIKPDWRLRRIEAFAFTRTRGQTPLKTGQVLAVDLDREVQGNTSATFPLNAGAIRTHRTTPEELQTRLAFDPFG